MNAPPATDKPGSSRLGRSRFGGGTFALVVGALLVGVATTAALVAVFLALNPNAGTALAAVVFTVVCLPAASAIGWVLLVDRSTIRGATPRPEESIESHWLNSSSAGAFRDILVVTGLAAAVFAFAQIEVSAVAVCVAICIFAQLDCGIRYAITRARAS